MIRLQAAEGDGPYSQLFSYLSVRNRCGVVSSWGSQVKDLYIIPLSANSPVPSAVLPFSGPGKLNLRIQRCHLSVSGRDRGTCPCCVTGEIGLILVSVLFCVVKILRNIGSHIDLHMSVCTSLSTLSFEPTDL